MSDVNEAIQNWRDAQDPRVVEGSVLAELEDHLRTEADALMALGLPGDDAVLLAAKRIGHPLPVSTELLKSDPGRIWRQRVFWLTCGYIVVTLSLWFTSFLTELVTGIGYRLPLSGPHLGLFVLFVFWSGYGLLIAALVWVARGGSNTLRASRFNSTRTGRRLAAGSLALLALVPAVTLAKSAPLSSPTDPFPLVPYFPLPDFMVFYGVDELLLCMLAITLLIGALHVLRPSGGANRRAGGPWASWIGFGLVIASATCVLSHLIYFPLVPYDHTSERIQEAFWSLNSARTNADWILLTLLFFIARSTYRSNRFTEA